MKTKFLKSDKKTVSSYNHELVVLDATDRVWGRFATEVANTLMGKNDPKYSPHSMLSFKKVRVENLDKIFLTGNKFYTKMYYKHSGYRGGIKSASFKELWDKNPEELFTKAVFGMLPKNKLRKKLISFLDVR